MSRISSWLTVIIVFMTVYLIPIWTHIIVVILTAR